MLALPVKRSYIDSSFFHSIKRRTSSPAHSRIDLHPEIALLEAIVTIYCKLPNPVGSQPAVGSMYREQMEL